jgi:hypothetical protein
MLLCANNALKQKTVHSCMAYCVHVSKHMFHYTKLNYDLYS